MDAWNAIKTKHFVVDERQLRSLFQVCRTADCCEPVHPSTVRIECKEWPIRVSYQCRGGHCGEWTSEPKEKQVISGKKKRYHCAIQCCLDVETTRNCRYCNDQHMMCTKSVTSRPSVCIDLIGLHPNVFRHLFNDIHQHRDTTLLFRTLRKFLNRQFPTADPRSYFPVLNVARCLLVTLIDLRYKMPPKMLAHCVFGVCLDPDHDAGVSLYGKFVESICAFWIFFLSQWASELRDDWLWKKASADGGGPSGVVEPFEIPLSSEFQKAVGISCDESANVEPRLKFAVLFEKEEASAAIVDWSAPAVTFRSDEEYVDFIAEERRWSLEEESGELEKTRGARKMRVRRFLRLFEKCYNWDDVTEASLRLNVSCLLANLSSSDDDAGVGELEF